jgi:outer membrane protein TolC
MFVACSIPLFAQSPLALKDAVKTALEKHPSVEASAARLKASETRIDQAKSGRLPRVNYQESWTRSDNPVFVFGSLLTQHQFTEKNFDIGTLNRPGFLNNFQSLVTVDQTIYDGGQTKAQMRSAQLGQSVAGEDVRLARQNVIASVVRAYYGVVLGTESLNVAREAVRSAEADLKRAEAVRSAGMSTDADVLSIRVHLAAMREQEIRRQNELDVANAALNEAMGLPLDARHTLETALTPAQLKGIDEKTAMEQRPEARQLKLATQIAETQAGAAKGSYWPQVFARAGFEADRQKFVNTGGANWMVSAGMRWNLFNGFADKAKIAEANEAVRASQAQLKQLNAGIQLQVRQAQSSFNAASQRIDVARAAVEMAEESLRITKNRYEAGLTTVTDLLRNETALLETKTRLLAAVYDERLAATAVELAAGTLSTDSEVLN